MPKYELPEHYRPSEACPFCGATEDVLSSGDFSKDKSHYTVVRHCNKCDAVWKDLYNYIATKVVD